MRERLLEISQIRAFPKELSEIKTALDSGRNSAVFYAQQYSRYHIISEVSTFFLYVSTDMNSARDASEILSEYTGRKVILIPERDDTLLRGQRNLSFSAKERLTALTELTLSENAAGAVITPSGLLQLFPKKELFEKNLIILRKGENYDISEIRNRLAASGYKFEDIAENPGDFSVRGDILDIFPINSELPIRVEFFGDTVESIRLFAPESMASLKETEIAVISPASDLFTTKEALVSAFQKLKRIRESAGSHLKNIITEVEEELSINPSSPSLLFTLPFIRDYLSSISDYLPNNTVIAFDETKIIDDKIKLYINSHRARVKSFAEGGEVTSHHDKSIWSREEIYSRLKEKTCLSFQQITSSNPVFEPQAIFTLKGLNNPKYNMNFELLSDDLRSYAIGGSKVFIFSGTDTQGRAIKDFLFQKGMASSLSEIINSRSDINIIPQRLSRGFVYPSSSLVVIGTDDIIRKTQKKTASGAKNKTFLTPVKGDYVVHDRHGIGLSEGLVPVDTKDGKKDYYVILYKGGDKLYLPVDQMDSLEKYTGGKDPQLMKLGGKEFDRVKERVRSSVKKIAIDLLSIYEKRLSLKGHKYSPDTVWQKELEDSFEFTETDDQLIAISEVKEDMESGKIMDRLLAGDVGFGKTEVAIRAIFKTVMEGKQAAILAPTTILCQQHYNTVKARFSSFGIVVDTLSRIVSRESSKEVLERIKSGKTSVIVATHRLLSKDVSFKDLGLLVLDEEQKFGVEHKEKIKLIKNNVNVLSMSATPIPRTLHMALSGIRDISTLETPPVNRLPIETYVLEYSDTLISDAVRREVSRGGQTFILYNRVQGIQSFTQHIQSLLGSDINVIFAHGQMDGAELDEKVTAFYNKEADVLISTTIIENGIDIPDANTLIVIDSDRLGLSELYQLRGRVGRSGSLAYAYFTVREGKVLTENAEKRLSALLNYTELGSGFKIAMQDLEIRGAGNILGREQHGNMEKVGYDMYTRILTEAVGELKGALPEVKRDVEILTDGDSSLPEKYIKVAEKRVSFYKAVASLSSENELTALSEKLKDIYGELPESVVSLTYIGLIKNLASSNGIRKVIATKEGTLLEFYDKGVYENEGVFKALSEMKDKAVLTPTEPPSVLFDGKGLPLIKRLFLIKDFLQRTKSL